MIGRGYRAPMLGLVLTGLLAAGASGPVVASAELARQKNCTACHLVDRKRQAPPFQAIAKRYAAVRVDGQPDPNLVQALVTRIRKGGVGVWGQIPMPANGRQVSEEEARDLVLWILSLDRP